MSNNIKNMTQEIQDRVRELAYLMWESAGRQQGMAMSYWLAAEKEILATAQAAAESVMPVKQKAAKAGKPDPATAKPLAAKPAAAPTTAKPAAAKPAAAPATAKPAATKPAATPAAAKPAATKPAATPAAAKPAAAKPAAAPATAKPVTPPKKPYS